jgi:hypothetical protein
MILGSPVGIGLGITADDNSKYGTYFGVNSNGNSWIQGGKTEGAIEYDLSLQASGGNIGIGTSNPRALLDVGGYTSLGATSTVLARQWGVTYLEMVQIYVWHLIVHSKILYTKD